ncbi:MAG: MFS transporter [archaeon]
MNEELRNKYRSNIWKTFALHALAGLTLFFGVVSIFYYQQYNLSYFQISIIAGAGLLTTLLAEVPTGAFADLYGRKKSISLGIMLVFIGLLIMTFTNRFEIFLVSSIVWGLGQAFISGAWEALLFDSLKKIKREKDYLQISTQQQSTSMIVMLISTLTSPYLFSINVKYPYYISSVAGLLFFLFTFTLFEPGAKRKNTFAMHIDQMKKGFKYSLSHKKLQWLFMFGIIMVMSNKLGRNLTGAPFVIAKGFTVPQYGLITFVSMIIMIVLMNFSSKLEKWLKEWTYAVMFFAWIIVSYLAFFSKGLFFIGFSSLGGSFQYILLLVVDSNMNNMLTKKLRATVISIFSMVSSLIVGITLFIVGYITDKTSIMFIVFVMITFYVVAGSLLLIMKGSPHA